MTHIIKTYEKKPKYILDELMAQCDLLAEFSEEDKAWLDSPPVGREEI